MLTCCKLPLGFDAAGLEADLRQIQPAAWIRHFNSRYYEGDWSGVALRAVDGASNHIYPDPSKSDSYADTPLLNRCASVRGVLASLACPVGSVRFLKLGPRARIIEHMDQDLSLEEGHIRLHVPVFTSPLVEFFVNGERVMMNPGECWYINASLPHRADNRGDSDRVHLVIDCRVNDWLRSMIEAGAAHAIKKAEVHTRSPEEFGAFCKVVFGDDELQAKLRGVRDNSLFVDLVVRLGEERGFPFNADDVARAIVENRRVWFQEWI